MKDFFDSKNKNEYGDKEINNKEENEKEIEEPTSDDFKKKDSYFMGYSETKLKKIGREYARLHNLDENIFEKAALVIKDLENYDNCDFITAEEKIALKNEIESKWDVPFSLVSVIMLGSLAAAVQGMDESVINGATLFYPKVFGITKENKKNYDLIEGLINGAPYLCSSVLSCWLTGPVNKVLGRKWTIFWTCLISAITCIWQGVVNNWWHLLIARFFLGFGIGIKSATVPIYAAESAPKRIRGSLVMLWQFFTAFGIMMGYISSLAFYNVETNKVPNGLQWRLMLGSAAIPAIIVLFLVPFVPESPRWLMENNKHEQSFKALCKLRKNRLIAARDCLYQFITSYNHLNQQNLSSKKKLKELFVIRRNRNGLICACIAMFMQQFCGINVIAYYSSSIFIESGFTEIIAMVASLVFGIINVVFSIPAFFTIDKFGRRFLLLVTYPLMALFLLVSTIGFTLDPEKNEKARLFMIIVGIYLFTTVYSSGEGAVAFTYAAEAFPMYVKEIGMSFATATCWFFNFILAFTWPRFVNALTVVGAFGFYAFWNIIGFFLVYFFMPETKNLSLEELNRVFSINLYHHAIIKFKTLKFLFRSKRYTKKKSNKNLK